MGSTKLKALAIGVFLSLMCFQQGFAQTFAEWFSQKKTQIKYLNEQITALLQYGSYVRQGYQISQNGLGSIGGWVKGEFDLHSAYYTSLKKVNPQFKGSAKADSIISYAGKIPLRFDHLNGLSNLDADSRAYVGQVKAAVLDGCNKDISELQTVINDGQAQMTDDERIKRLDGIYSRMKDKYAFTIYFCSQVRLLLLQRDQELKDINTLRQQYGIN
ncbi:hypothetical protein SNE26_10220 [Mucilaginibacter sp. cycad4]|uniref:hypothetical protein n=1 Tax=Mucilaginibacter sp. cycad4 TaxID=3342096 RepID=UPI002AAABC9D|nr:hypothetical protein [Mucilaginibacter gossypii]WPV02150.1 hypothetical protein SNE26_10220 [Mucilaginibacter gossypii]